MYLPSDIILTDFCPLSITTPLTQEKSIEYLIQLITRYICTHTPSEKPSAVERSVRESVEYFAVSPEHIHSRELYALTLTDNQSSPSKKLHNEGFYCIDNFPYEMSVRVRMEENARLAERILNRLYHQQQTPPETLIHVTSSGYSAPSPAQRFLANKGWTETVVSHIYHLGCYAAFPAVRAAAGALHTSLALPTHRGDKRVDILHTEYFSLHLNPTAREPEDIIAFTLFGDGFIKYSVVPGTEYTPENGGLRLIAMHEQLLPASADAMTWDIDTHSFALHLSKSVPTQIRDHCLDFTHHLCAKACIDLASQKDTMAYAIHTGGPKILDFIEEQLHLPAKALRHSRELLFDRGNMSSAACPHLWDRLIRDQDIAKGTLVLSLGFGPGLTMAGMIFEKV